MGPGFLSSTRRTSTGRHRVVMAVVLSLLSLTAATGCKKKTPSQPEDTPTQNRSPVIGSLSVSPSLAISGLTTVTMTAAATDADNDSLTFTWTFGGTTATGATVTRTLTGDGNVTVQLSVSDGRGGTATDTRTVTVGTMTGTWFQTDQFPHRPEPCGAGPGEQPGVLTLQQNGTAVTGTLFYPGPWCGITPQTAGTFIDPVTIDAQGNFSAPRIRVVSGTVGAFFDFSLTGQMDATGRKITGVDKDAEGERPFTLTKQ
jgi:hypothetical protein